MSTHFIKTETSECLYILIIAILLELDSKMKSLRLLLLLSFAVSVISSQRVLTAPGQVVLVTRRSFFDIYDILERNKTQRSVCNNGDNVTYLVAEKQCISNQYLFNGNNKIIVNECNVIIYLQYRMLICNSSC